MNLEEGVVVVPEGEDTDGDEDGDGFLEQPPPPPSTLCFTPPRVAAKGRGESCPLFCPSPCARLLARPTNIF